MLRRTGVALIVCVLGASAAYGQGIASPSGAAAVGPASTLSRDWKRLSYSGVTVVGNASAGDLRRAALQLEGFKQAMRQLLGPLDVSSPVPNVLVVFRDDAAMGRFKPRDERGRTQSGVAGYFETTPDVNYMVMSTMWTDEQMLSVLFHEYTHYIVHRNMQRVPTWASEGVAEFFSTYRQGDDGQVTVGSVPTMRVRALSSGRWFPIGKLLTREGTAEALRIDGDRYYAESWGLVHYLLLNKERQGQLAAYLRAVQAGTPVGPAFQGAFHASPEQVDSAPYASFVGALAFGRLNEPAKAHALMQQVKASVADTSWQAAVARYLDGEITAGALLGRADGAGQQTEAHAYIGMLSATAGRRDEALEHLTWVRDKGSRNYLEYRLAVADLKRLKPAQD